MNLVESLKLNLQNAFKKLGFDVALNDIVIEHSRDAAHGDYATNAAMKLCRLFSKPPRDVASLLINELDMSNIEKVEIAGPGFINFFMKNESLQTIIKIIDVKGDNFGRQERQNFKINVEFVSANPTGLLHVGTARGAAYGDSLCRILD